MLKKILVAFDGSDNSRKAFGVALDFAARFKASLTVVTVAELPEPATVPTEIDALMHHAKAHYELEFKRLREAAESQGVEFSSQLAVGHPAEQIVNLAEQQKADMIVVGRRGLTKTTRWLMGSVSERVLQYAHCPVTVVK
jgi:nucleotide-binding universal stress UspA family protein